MSARAASVLCGVALLLCGATTPTTAVEELALERDIWGYFRPARRPPAAFANIAELHLAGRGEYGWKASPPYFGMIKTKNSATYSLRQPVLDGSRVRFVTEAVAGVSYDFAGVLAQPDFSGEAFRSMR